MPRAVDVARAATVGAVLSGLPSTAHALATGRDAWEATLAAGSLLRDDERPWSLVVAAVPVHAAVSLLWTCVLSAALPAGRRVRYAAPAATVIATIDLGIIGRRWPRIRALPLGPQLADHLAFAVITTWMLDHGAQGQA